MADEFEEARLLSPRLFQDSCGYFCECHRENCGSDFCHPVFEVCNRPEQPPLLADFV